MILKELHRDIERYLLEDCYCPHEVYSFDGFCYMLVYEDAECELLGEYNYKGTDVFLVATYTGKEKKNPILLLVWHDNNSILDMERYELTDNNIREIRAVLKGEKSSAELSEMESVKESVRKILSISDAILVD